jgi:hypothetical protein
MMILLRSGVTVLLIIFVGLNRLRKRVLTVLAIYHIVASSRQRNPCLNGWLFVVRNANFWIIEEEQGFVPNLVRLAVLTCDQGLA